MTRDETKKILERVCRLYVTQARKLTAEQRVIMIDTWADEFTDESCSAVDDAVSAYMRQGKPFMPEVADIVNMLNARSHTPRETANGEGDKLFDMMARMSEVLAKGLRRTSIVDPGGFRWDAERQRNVYHHAEVVINDHSYTQYDFAQLPEEIQEYVEDIDGLRSLWREIENNRNMARARFVTRLPAIKAEIRRTHERNRLEHMKRLEELQKASATR